MLRAFAHHVVCCCVLLRLVGWSLKLVKLHPTTSNNSQQHATTHNMVCKRSQHVEPNNVACCWPTMLRAFAPAFTACRVIASQLISVYFWLILPRKWGRISAWEENNHCLCGRTSAVFHGFYLVQNFCICIECSKCLVYSNNWIGCRISASALNAVNVWSILTIE